jgi:hypothetical protein
VISIAYRGIFPSLVIIFLLYILTACSTESHQEIKTQTIVSTQNLSSTATLPQIVVEPSKTATEVKRSHPTPTGNWQITPTNSPQPNVASSVEFSIDSASKELPADLMDEIIYFIGACCGESYDPSGNSNDPCEDAPRNVPSFKREPNTEICLYCRYYVSTCGWDPNENIRVIVQLKDGESITITGQSDRYGYFSYSLSPTADDLPGEYSVEISGKTGRLKTTFSKIAPTETGSFLDKDLLVLYNFVALEKIRLIIYQDNSDNSKNHLKFIGWQDYQVDANGALRIHIDFGPETRVKYQIDAEKSGNHPYSSRYLCEGKGGSFAVNDKVQVVNPNGAPLFESSQQSRFYIADRVIKNGELAMVTAGPLCMSGSIYWLLELSDESSGWIPEEARGGNRYFEVQK